MQGPHAARTARLENANPRPKPEPKPKPKPKPKSSPQPKPKPKPKPKPNPQASLRRVLARYEQETGVSPYVFEGG